jgi:putative peptide zinc metalloprotease protein
MTATATTDETSAAATAAVEELRSPRLLPGTELIGRFAGSGLREPPYLVRRSDGQIVQLSQTLYEIASRMDGHDLAAIADSAGRSLKLRLTPEHVAHVAEHKLAPLGIVAYRDGSTATLQRPNAVLALRFRAGILPAPIVNALARFFRPLLLPPIVIAAFAALVACDLWLASSRGLSTGLRAVIQTPTLGLVLLALLLLSLTFHELGHAAACRYGGARPGQIGIGIYLVWPVFYTDVTDSWRLSKAGRLRTDLGGVYFNALFALTAAGAYLATSYKPLLIVIATQQLLALDQFVPWVRLDGYHIVSDLIGVPDLFTRIKPVINSMLPHRAPDPPVSDLKPSARAAVTAWVLSTIAALLAVTITVATNAPDYLQQGYRSLLLQLSELTAGVHAGSITQILGGATGALTLLLPLAGITLAYLRLCRHLGNALAVRHARADPTPRRADQKKHPHPRRDRFPIASNTMPAQSRPRALTESRPRWLA